MPTLMKHPTAVGCAPTNSCIARTQVLLLLALLLLIAPKLSAQTLKASFWTNDVRNNVTFTNMIEPSRTMSIKFSGTTSFFADTGSASITLPQHVTYVSHRVDDIIGSSREDGYQITENDGTLTLTYTRDLENDPFQNSNSFEIWLVVETASLAELPHIAPTWNMPLSMSAQGNGNSENLERTEEGYWLYNRLTTTLLSDVTSAKGDDILEYKVELTNYPHEKVVRNSFGIQHPYGTDIIPDSVTGINGTSLYDNSLAYLWKDEAPSSISMTYAVKVRAESSLDFFDITEFAASASCTLTVETDHPDSPRRIHISKSNTTVLPRDAPEDPGVNMWFTDSETPYVAGLPNQLVLNFFLTEEMESRTIEIVPPLTSTDEHILKVPWIDFPESFTLTPEDPRRTFEIPIELIGAGLARIAAEATAIKPDGSRVSFSNDRGVRVDEGLTVTLTEVGRESTGALAIGDETTVRLLVKAPRSLSDNLTNVRFADPAGLEIPDLFEISKVPESTAIGSLRSGEEVAFDWTLKAARPGRFTVSHHLVTAEKADGSTITSNKAELNGSVQGFRVAIELPKADALTLKPKESGDPDAPSGFEPLEFQATIQVSVPEKGEPIKNVTLQGFDASDGGIDIDLVEATGLESEPWQDVQPQPVPAPVWVSKRSSIGTLPQTLQPGKDPGEFHVTITATRPGTFELAALITASPEDESTTITGRGTNVADIKGEVVLSIELEVVNDPPRITEGEAVEITGVVENVSLTETLILDPLLVLSSGQGLPRGPVALEDALPPVGVPGIFNPVLEPGERERFRLRVQTVSLPGFDQREMARQSVIIDFAASGKIVSADGKETRDLDNTSTVVEWGNGSFEVAGKTFLRAAVEADLRPTNVLTPEQFVAISAGKSLENLVGGASEAVAAMPGMLANLPTAFYGVANLGGRLEVEKRIASYNAARYLWAWTDLQIDVWAGLDTSQREQNLRLIGDELALYYGDHFESVEQVRQLVNRSVTDYMVRIEEYEQRAYDAAGYGYNMELAEIVGEPFRPIGGLAIEEAASALAIASWTAKVSRSRELVELAALREQRLLARGKTEADVAVQFMQRQGDPRITEMPDPMKALPASTPLTQKHAVDGWGVDPVSDRNLIRMTDVKNGGMPIFVAIRSRADETIEWMKTQLGIVPKPMTFKPKNVNADDVKYLGYRDGVGYGDANGVGAGDRGATLLAEPIPRDVVIKRLEGADEVTKSRVLDRHADRWEEWYGHKDFNSRVIDREESKFFGLSGGMKFDVSDGRRIGKGTLGVPRRGSVPQPDINADTVGPGILDARQFELRQVNDPPDNDLFEGGRQYYECWLEDDLRTPTRSGAMRRIAGDIDTVAVGLADGSALPIASEFSETVAKNMLHGVQAQHPWSSTLTIDKLYQKFVNNGTHRWHPDPALRGEPLIIYVNGERRVGWFHPSRTITAENPLKNFMWVDGGTADVDNVIRFQKDMRGNLDDVDVVNPPVVKPTTSIIRDALLTSDITESTNLIATCTISTARTGGTLYRLSRNTIFEKQNEDGSWSEADPSEGCGDDSGIVIWPETFMSAGVVSGTTRIPIIEDLLDFDWQEMFQIGDHIIIDPGGANEEHRTVAAHGSLVLDRPLTFSHAMGVRIVSAGADTNDIDADGLSTALEIALNTNPAVADTDDDGVDDGTEFRLGTNPLVPDQLPFPNGVLTVQRLEDGGLNITWPADITGLLEESDTMIPGTWTPVPEASSAGARITRPTQRSFFRLRP